MAYLIVENIPYGEFSFIRPRARLWFEEGALLEHLNRLKLHYKESDTKHVITGDGGEKERVKVLTTW